VIYGHPRARWLYSSITLSMCSWAASVWFGTVQILEWVLVIVTCWGITTIEWALAELNAGSIERYKKTRDERVYANLKVKWLVWLEVLLGLALLGQLATAFGLSLTDVMVEQTAPWIIALFVFIVVSIVAYIFANCVFAMNNHLNNGFTQDIVIVTIMTFMAASVSLIGFIGQYIDLNP
jgi:hypothetical protein